MTPTRPTLLHPSPLFYSNEVNEEEHFYLNDRIKGLVFICLFSGLHYFGSLTAVFCVTLVCFLGLFPVRKGPLKHLEQ